MKIDPHVPWVEKYCNPVPEGEYMHSLIKLYFTICQQQQNIISKFVHRNINMFIASCTFQGNTTMFIIHCSYDIDEINSLSITRSKSSLILFYSSINNVIF